MIYHHFSFIFFLCFKPKLIKALTTSSVSLACVVSAYETVTGLVLLTVRVISKLSSSSCNTLDRTFGLIPRAVSCKSLNRIVSLLYKLCRIQNFHLPPNNSMASLRASICSLLISFFLVLIQYLLSKR